MNTWKKCLVEKPGLTPGKVYVSPGILPDVGDAEPSVFCCNDLGKWEAYPLEWFAPVAQPDQVKS